MIIHCNKCLMYLDDEFRTTVCPHEAFPANDGNNNFHIHEDAYLSEYDPATRKQLEASRIENKTTY